MSKNGGNKVSVRLMLVREKKTYQQSFYFGRRTKHKCKQVEYRQPKEGSKQAEQGERRAGSHIPAREGWRKLWPSGTVPLGGQGANSSKSSMTTCYEYTSLGPIPDSGIRSSWDASRTLLLFCFILNKHSSESDARGPWTTFSHIEMWLPFF